MDEELDWLLFKVGNFSLSSRNEIVLNEKRLRPKRIFRDTPPDKDIWAVTGNTGVVKGHISGTPFYLSVGGRKGFQKVWVARLERNISKLLLVPLCRTILTAPTNSAWRQRILGR